MSVLMMDSFDWNGAVFESSRYLSNGGTPEFSNTQTKHGAGYALRLVSSENVAYEFTADQSGNVLIVGFYIYIASHTTTSQIIFSLKDSVGVIQVSLVLTHSAHKLEVWRQGTVKLGSTGTHELSVGAWYHIEWKIKVTNSLSAGECIVNVDGEEDINESSGDSQGAATGSVKQAQLISTYFGADYYFDDFYVLDTNGSFGNDFIGPYPRIEYLDPDGNGNDSDFVGSDADSVNNYLHVDEASHDSSTTYVESSTASHRDGYSFSDLVGSVSSIVGVQVGNVMDKEGGSGARTAKVYIRRSAADYDGTKTFSLSDGIYIVENEIWVLDPSTSAQWTETNVNAIDAGIKVEA